MQIGTWANRETTSLKLRLVRSGYNSLLWTLPGDPSAATGVSGPLLPQVGQACLPGLGCSKNPSFSTHPTVRHMCLLFCLPTMVLPSPLSHPVT